jgi:endonuclease/exonuclease/phosphatase family metal-dependent hydrolase
MRLATFNVLHGRSLRDGRVDVARYAAAVRSLDADVLALQEVDRDQPRSERADLTAVAAQAMGAVASRFVAALSGMPGAGWKAATEADASGCPGYGIALLSRYPVRAWRVVRLPALPVRAPLLVRGRRLVLVHDEPRVGVAAILDTPYGELVAVATHLSFLPGWNIVQLSRLLRAVDPGDRPLVLLGDLNMGARLAARVSRMRPLATALTFPAQAPDRQLDHVLARGPLPAERNGWACELPLSDHRALVVQL